MMKAGGHMQRLEWQRVYIYAVLQKYIYQNSSKYPFVTVFSSENKTLHITE